MFKYALLIVLFLCTLTPAALQTRSREVTLPLNELTLDNVTPIARFGWGWTYDIQYFPDGETFALLTSAGVTLYRNNLEPSGYISTKDQQAYHLAISPDGTVLATGGTDVRLWDTQTGSLLQWLKSGRSVSGLAFSPDGALLAVTKSGPTLDGIGGILLFETTSGRLQKHFTPEQQFMSPTFEPNGKRLFALQYSACCRQIFAFDVNSGESQMVTDDGSTTFVITPDGANLIVANEYRRLSSFDLANLTGEPIQSRRLQDEDSLPTVFNALRNTPNGTVSYISMFNELVVVDAGTLAHIETRPLKYELGASVAISPDGEYVAAVDRTGIGLHWIDTQTGYAQRGALHVIPRFGPIAFDYALVLFINGASGSIWYWDIETNYYFGIGSHSAAVNAIIFGTHDLEGWALSTGDDGTIRRWNIEITGSGDGSVLFEQPGTQIKSLIQSDIGDLFAVLCENQQGRLIHLSMEGESLGFTAPGNGAVSLQSIELTSCDVSLSHAEQDAVFYSDSRYFYRLDVAGLDDIQRDLIPLTEAVFPIGQRNTLIKGSTVFTWRPFDSAPAEVAVSHGFEVTAVARVGDGPLYASAICTSRAPYVEVQATYCDQVQMALTRGDGQRVWLTEHSGMIRRIVPHPTLPLLVTQSADGTIILWGAPVEPQPMWRGSEYLGYG